MNGLKFYLEGDPMGNPGQVTSVGFVPVGVEQPEGFPIFYGSDIDPDNNHGLNVNNFYAIEARPDGGGKIIPVSGNDTDGWVADLDNEVIVPAGSGLVVPSDAGVVQYGTYTPTIVERPVIEPPMGEPPVIEPL